jgi:hypothetical protein
MSFGDSDPSQFRGSVNPASRPAPAPSIRLPSNGANSIASCVFTDAKSPTASGAITRSIF